MRVPRAIMANVLMLPPAVLVPAQNAGGTVIRQDAISEYLYLAGGDGFLALWQRYAATARGSTP